MDQGGLKVDWLMGNPKHQDAETNLVGDVKDRMFDLKLGYLGVPLTYLQNNT